MNAIEFTSWLKGFMDALEGAPSKKQLHAIRKKLNSVNSDRIPNITTVNPVPSTFPNNPNPFIVTCEKPENLVPINGINQSSDSLFNAKIKNDSVVNSTIKKPYVGPYTIK